MDPIRSRSFVMPRIVDLSMIVSGAIAPVAIGIDAEADALVDGTPVALAAAFALSVFPAFGLYAADRRRSATRLLSSTVVAWAVVQGCCAGLLFALDHERALPPAWFACWTLVTCIGLLAIRGLALVGSGTDRHLGSITPSPNRDRAIVATATRFNGAPNACGTAKRVLDLIVATILIVLLSPLLAVIALAIRLDGGPCLYAHVRIGHRGRPFRCLKFRTMRTDADHQLKRLLETDPQARTEWACGFKLKHDTRITAIGRMLRRTSLDELPQFVNVIRGDMSLVGPRPVVSAELSRYGSDIAYYLAVRPGMTGLWQVSGRNDIGYAARVALDVRYVRTWSMARDLRILVKTIGVVARGTGAY
ncbi:sugar transferase [Burkholderia sp. BCC0044]|uniref:sugar transferase n=1 Tax=Burkholderia sp. BCC0044 TaxID=2676295 RepID=UPI001FC8B53A|nr:sugar transferase [Burkholderia sp. BCC0044]